MSKQATLGTIMAVAMLGLTAPLLGQARSAVTGAELDAAVAARPASNREAVRELLATDQAQRIASRIGVDLSEVSARVATLDQASLNVLAQRADVDDRILAGGANTIVISTTTIIIALLLIILLV